MSKSLGIVLILAGIGVASTLLPFGTEADAVASGSAPVAGRTESSPTGWERGRPAERPADVVPIVVTLTHSAAPQPSPAPAIAMRNPVDRGALARELQVELRRVGCYSGEVNGIWTPNAQKAMKAFTAHVNAALPVDNPDDILLSLVRAHKGVSCAKDCATGHRRAEDGRCVLDALPGHASKEPAARAEAARKLELVGSGWATVTTSAPLNPAAAPPPFGRMALAGPQGDAPGTAAEPPSRPQAVRESGKRSRAARRESPHARVRRAERSAVVRSSRSRFVESVLYDRRSLN